MDDTEVFPSKVAPWLGVLIAAVPLMGVGSFVSLIPSGEASLIIMGALSMLGTLLIIPAFVFPLRYELHDDAVVICSGIVRARVPYDRIHAVTPRGSYVLSLDPQHVKIGAPRIPRVSPADKQGFLHALARRAPHLRLAGDRLVPAP